MPWFIYSRLDYCNSVLARLPWSLVQQLQSMLNSAARLIFGLKRFDHITPALMDLHWLPYPQRITYKAVYDHVFLSACVVLPLLILLTIALVLLWCLVDRLWDLLLMVTLLFLVIGLTGVWDLLRWLGPSSWNALPVGLRSSSFGLDTFAKHLKTHLFDLAYSRQGTHFWVCITFCRVRHGDSVTKPDYYYYYYYYYYYFYFYYSNCVAALDRYTKRHDAVLRILANWILNNTKPDREILADLSIGTHGSLSNLVPFSETRCSSTECEQCGHTRTNGLPRNKSGNSKQYKSLKYADIRSDIKESYSNFQNYKLYYRGHNFRINFRY